MYGEFPVLYMYNIQGVRFVSNYIMYRYLLMVFIVRGLRAVSLISKRDHVSSIPFLYINDDERSNNYFIKVVIIIKISMIISNVVLSSAVIIVIS